MSLGNFHHIRDTTKLKKRGVTFKSLADPIDTSSSDGTLTIQVLGAVAEFERSLISERTRAGVANARANGRMPGNPKLQNITELDRMRMSQSRKDGHLESLINRETRWLPEVKKMRPQSTWESVARQLNERLAREGWPPSEHWSC
ncbi:recombinase family protein [Poseidonocella sp. HB161398]|uniref:recombinase family protein n=1 Tax=Poseidonocella sp. HB161398 TaxID=2320855 RepID=UPI001108D386|nr:recombinase family protein [Poseidonocella sp. HB161398]